jgi:hypothetical protein
MEIDGLQRKGMFKSQITLDRHNARPRLNYYFLPDPSHFSLPSTFNATLSILADLLTFLNFEYYKLF